MQADRTIVQVFAKAPVPGEVKTRLIPHIGAEAAAELYCRMLRRTLATVAIARIGLLELWTSEPADEFISLVFVSLFAFRVEVPSDEVVGPD